MKNLNAKQIEIVKSLQVWSNTNFHGNTKNFKGVPVEIVKTIVAKKLERNYLKNTSSKRTVYETFKQLLSVSKSSKGTSYFKTLIEGNKNIYYASPVYGHSDYNKSIAFRKNEETLKLMEIFNKLV